MLAEALPFCWDELRLPRVLISCLEGNEGSRRAIEANGGAYESTIYDPLGHRLVRRYWIEGPRRLLVTGFEPFGGAEINPSWEAVKALPDQVGGWKLVKLRLPVIFGEAARQAISTAESLRADAVLAVGMAGGRAAVTPEKVAVNLRHAAIPDNAGNCPQDAPIVPGAPDAYFATLPVREMAKAIENAGLPAAVSYSAGAFVCNDVMYSLLHHFAGTGVRAGFLHVPYSTGMGSPSLPMEDIARALEAGIKAMNNE
ncbi:MAG: pyroglutamyl-peptidase I [Clostridia bacterium]|nr:pyroglutamyl-peptidase I [Clostridia bacterium]